MKGDAVFLSSLSDWIYRDCLHAKLCSLFFFIHYVHKWLAQIFWKLTALQKQKLLWLSFLWYLACRQQELKDYDEQHLVKNIICLLVVQISGGWGSFTVY